MNFIRRALLVSICFTSIVFAAELPSLKIGIENFNPPFVMQGSKQQLYGFDIDMMNKICKMMQRTCTYQVMRFDQFFDAIINKQIDLAVGSITITPDRSKIVSFSMPYLVSNSRFLTKPTLAKEHFSLNILKGKRIGIESGSILQDQLNSLNVNNSVVKLYPSVNDEINGLYNDEVDTVLLDNPTAIYWASNTQDAFKLLGPSLPYGYGLGIAVNINNPVLLQAVNNALQQYQKSEDYQKNYNQYFMDF